MSAAHTSSSHRVDRAARARPLDLRVLSGTHAGAEMRLPERGILMIGQADDCDLILSDTGVAAHHCVLTVMGDQVLLRALEGVVDTEEGGIATGEHIALEHFAVIRLGETRMAVGPHWSERWQALADAVGNGHAELTEQQTNARRRSVLMLAGLLLLVAGLVLFGSWAVMHRAPEPARQSTRQMATIHAIIGQLKLSNVNVSDDNGQLLVRGVVRNPAQIAQLQQRLNAAGLVTDLNVRDLPSVAGDVNRIFAMHHYRVQTTLLDHGGIEVAGHFGDADLGEVRTEVYGSNDMQGLSSATLGLHLALRNLDAGKPAPPKLDPGKTIRQLVVDSKTDTTYLITKDDSRYYPDTTLPQGGVFIGSYENGNVLVKMPNGALMQLMPADKYGKPHPLDTNGIDTLVPAAAASSADISAAIAAAVRAHPGTSAAEGSDPSSGSAASATSSAAAVGESVASPPDAPQESSSIH